MNITTTTPLFTHSLIQQFEESALRARMEFEYAHEMLTEMVAAKRRAFTAKLNLAQNHVRKLLLLEHLKHVNAYERELYRIHAVAMSAINQSCLDAERTIYIAEDEEMKQAQSEFDAGLLSQADYERRRSGIQRQTDEAVCHAKKCAEELTGHCRNTYATTMDFLTGETATKH